MLPGTVSPPSAPRAARWPQVAIRSYGTLAEAERAVELLVRRSFPREYVEVAARGLRRCAHRQEAPPLRRGIARCSAVGAAVAVAAGLIGIGGSGAAVPGFAVFGAAVGVVLAWLLRASVNASDRGCQCSGRVSADAYDVLVDAEWATDADKVLAVPERTRRLGASSVMNEP